MTKNESTASDAPDSSQPDDDAQVSEVGRMDPAEADTPIQADQATSGSPAGESGEVQEGAVGPNAKIKDS